jgi:ASC-1-like (ASCH) protein
MTARPAATTGVRAREMNLYRRYFDLVAAGRKTIEVRVQYPNLRKLAAGDHIRFVCGRDDALTVVKRVTRYRSFEEMLDARVPRRSTRQPPRPSRSLRQAAEAYDRAARVPFGRIPARSATGYSLRRGARLLGSGVSCRQRSCRPSGAACRSSRCADRDHRGAA